MAEVSRETQRTLEASTMFPGFRFSPTDVELIYYYLRKKMDGDEKSVEVIPEVEICRHEPWDLPGQSVIQSENEWFFFSSRGRKYPNGSQSKRATEHGYWKATGKERNVKSGSEVIGTKRTLVFHLGRAPKGERTEWIMHEYSMQGNVQDSLVVCRLRKNADFRASDNSTQVSIPQRQLSSTQQHSGGATTGGENDWVGGAEGESAAGCSRRCSSSYDSDSIEQLDSASESEQRQSSAVNPAGSTSHQTDCPEEDDCYAEILKDDIIKLDETSLSPLPASLPVVASNYMSESQQQPPQPAESLVSQALPADTSPVQGAAKRRIRYRRHIAGLPPPVPEQFTRMTREYHIKKPKSTQQEEQPKHCITAAFHKMSRHQLLCTGLVILTLLVLYLYFGFRDSQQVRGFVYASRH